VTDAELWPYGRGGAPVTVLAHRGGSGPWVENTVEAFESSLRAGADGVELDVRRCADGALVVHHDPAVPGAGLIHERRRDELPTWIPTLEVALASCAGAIVNVEIKNVPTDPGYDPTNRVALDVAAVLGRIVVPGEPWPSAIVVSSFWPDTLAAAAAATGGVALALLVHPALDAPSALETAAELRCVALNPHHSQVTGELVGRAHEGGLAVMTWTVNAPEDLDAAVECGVDAVITDDVVGTLAHLERG
jgi:glycerophosphoryl diester phosphodiesterase